MPAACASVLAVGSLCTGRWCPDVGAGTDTSAVGAAGITSTTADAAARRLAALHDPEDAAARRRRADVGDARPGAGRLRPARSTTPSGSPPTGPAPIATATRSPASASVATAWWRSTSCATGRTTLVAGTTGSGKSELLRTMVASIAADAGPDDVTFVLIDYKGGATFDACRDLPHTVGVVTDLDERLAARAIRSLDAEIRRRERALRDAGAVDLADYRRAPRRDGRTPLPRLVVVIDEFAALAVELPTFLSSLVGVAQRGRSLGIHLVLATQRPAGVVSDDIRANTNIRIALRLNDRHDAIDVVGSAAPAALPRSLPGRAVLRLGPEELVTFQTATSSAIVGRAAGLALVGSAAASAAVGVGDAAASELVTLARAARAAASLCEVSAPARPWLEPLPPRLTGAEPELAADVDGGGRPVGVIDDPDHQRRRPLVWRDDAGSLLVVGATGSGTTSALVSVVVAAAPSSAAIYVIDARGDAALASLGALPACAGVVGLHDAERRGRVVRRLTDELARRRSGRGGGPLLLAVDGLPSLLSALATHDDACRARCMGAPDRRGGGGRHPLRGDRRPAGRAVAVGAGVVRRTVGAPPRRCRRRRHPRAAAPSRARGDCPGGPSSPPAGSRPSSPCSSRGHRTGRARWTPWSRSARSPPSCTRPHCPRRAAWTVRASSASGSTSSPSARRRLTVPDGEHVVVLGPARSGRSTALVRIAAAWRERPPVRVGRRGRGTHRRAAAGVGERPRPGRSWCRRWPRSSRSLDRSAADGHGLIVVDDAERVDDHADALATLIARRDPPRARRLRRATRRAAHDVRTLDGRGPAQSPGPAARARHRRRRRPPRRGAAATYADLGPSRPGVAGGRRRPSSRPGRRRPARRVPPDGDLRDSGARNRADLHENACGNRVSGAQVVAGVRSRRASRQLIRLPVRRIERR